MKHFLNQTKDYLISTKQVLISTIQKQPKKVLIVIVVFFILQTIFSIEGALFLSIFLLFFLLKWNFQVFFIWGVMVLMFCPFLLIFKQEVFAEQAAIYAYYFLFMGTVLHIISLFKKN